jgi:hypothetical protein
MSKDIEGQEFIIKDRRSSNISEEDAKKSTADPKAGEPHAEEFPQFELNFSTFVLSLTSSAFYHLGELADPQTGETHVELNAVKQTIDILLMIQEKTKGNLTSDEAKLLEHLIYELQMKFVAKSKK